MKCGTPLGSSNPLTNTTALLLSIHGIEPRRRAATAARNRAFRALLFWQARRFCNPSSPGQVLFHLVQAHDHCVQGSGIHSLGDELTQLGLVTLAVTKRGSCGRRHLQTPDAMVRGILVALDEAERLDAVYEASDRNRSDPRNGG